MMNSIVTMLDSYAEIMMYPESDLELRVQRCLAQIPDERSDVKEIVGEYLTGMAPLSLSEREELYIKTFDLNKTGTLDLGWHLFGEDYNRGLFLVKVRQYLQLLKIPETNELPDHVSQVLRVLGRMSHEEANQFAYACVIPSLRTIAEGIPEATPHERMIEGLILLLTSIFEVPVGFEESADSEFETPFGELPVIQ